MHNHPWELYELETDPTELNNLVNKQMDIANSLEKQWNIKASELGVRPWPVKK